MVPMEPICLLHMLRSLDGQGPRYSQITRALRTMIKDGALPFDSRLPATRDLAQDLGCSRNIVLLAYEQLVLEGYLVTRRGAGTFVAPEWPRGPAPAGAPRGDMEAVRLSERGRLIVGEAEWAWAVMTRRSGLPIDFIYGLCEPDPRVVARLRAALNSALRSRTFHYGDRQGDPGLRQQVADRLRAARGIVRAGDQIVVTNGIQQALAVCVRLR